MKICKVPEMRQLDRTAVEKFGIKEELLMENAGLAACFVLSKKMDIKNNKFLVFCGMGNNGGDGFVIARKIHSNGGTVKVVILGDKEKYTGAAQLNLNIISKLPIKIKQYESLESVKTDLHHCDTVIDAIFGTGLARNVAGKYYDVIELINSSKSESSKGKTVLAVDIPSGVHGDSGKVMGTAVNADYTVTFGLPKIGNILYPGYDLGGKLYVTHISFPPSLYNAEDLKISINEPIKLPDRETTGHKGSFGNVLFIAGAAGYYGAPGFAAMSFLKTGGGYSRLASPKSITPFIAGKASEIVFVPQEETASGSIAKKNKKALLELSEKMDMVVIGPGLSLNEETCELARELAHEIDKPLLLDGDGITALCKDLSIIQKRKAETLLTPHLSEMSRLIDLNISEIDADKINVLQKTTDRLNSTIVLKGAHSLTGYPDGNVFINMSGNSGMATAGSGDVLTGAIAAMYGLGLTAQDAARQGVFIHGLAGDIAADAKGKDGITARDILNYLPHAMKRCRYELENNISMIDRKQNGKIFSVL